MRYLILLAAVAAAIAGYYAYWNSLSDGLSAGVDRWIVEQQKRGYVVEHAGFERHRDDAAANPLPGVAAG